MIPFFGWAIVLLRRRYVYYEENSLQLEAGTLGALALFFWIEALILRHALGHQTLLYFFAVLGLSVAAFALYAHVAISLASRLVVDLVVPGDETALNQPRFGPVDALERSEDYEGALLEYLVLARIYPRNFEVLRRTGRVQELLENHEEAATWYLRARKRASTAQEALTATNRLCAIYDGALDQPESADEVLVQFLEDYPESPDRILVIDRLERRATKSERSISAILQALEETPLAAPGQEDAAEPINPSVSLPAVGRPLKAPKPAKPALVALEEEGASPIPAPDPAEHDASPGGKGSDSGASAGSRLEQLDKVGVAATGNADPQAPAKAADGSIPRTAAGTNGSSKSGKPSLEPLEHIETTDTTPPEPRERPRKRSGMSLDTMEVDEP